MAERKQREPEEKQELRELWELFRSQERELHEMRLRLSRFMTKGAPVFMQPPKVESRVSSHKSKYQPHVHFSRSLTNGSNEEQKEEENFQEALQDVQSRLHKGRPGFHAKQQSPMTEDGVLEGNYANEMHENKDKESGSIEKNIGGRKKSSKKLTGGARPKSSRAVGKRPKSSKTSSSKNLEDLQNELLMDPEVDEDNHEGLGNLTSPGHESHPDSESKHESEVGDDKDDTSKDFTSLSLATASASGGKQTNPKISVTDDAQ